MVIYSGQYFHNIGISERAIKYLRKNGTFEFMEELLPFRYLVRMLGHQGRRIDYLKIDIENSEWIVRNYIIIINKLCYFKLG